MDVFQMPPGSVAQPNGETPAPAPAPKPADGSFIAWSSTGESKAPLLNLVFPVSPPLVPEAVVAKAAGKFPVWPVAVGAVVLLVGAGGGYYWVFMRHPAQPVAVATPTPTPSPSASATPTPTPSPTPTPTPSPTPTPQLTIQAPTTTPTADHPQSLRVTSNSGLWLRSSPTSVNRSNIIGWMPNGATVSVDQVGDFWWHGTYKGQAGYFASKYTQ
jgi:hypothetical protein